MSTADALGLLGQGLAPCAAQEFDFYLATKHYGVHLLYRLGLSKRAMAAQMGWTEQAVEGLLRIYGHADLVALAEVDAPCSERDFSDAPSDAKGAETR